jgi:hypothetical protein
MAAANSPTGISKIDAVRSALKELGNDAMPGKIQDFVKEKFGLEMSTGHVSNYKSHLLKKKGKRGRKKKVVDAAPTAMAAAPVKAAAPVRVSVSLTDIAAVKELVGRVGEDNLKNLIGLLG